MWEKKIWPEAELSLLRKNVILPPHEKWVNSTYFTKGFATTISLVMVWLIANFSKLKGTYQSVFDFSSLAEITLDHLYTLVDLRLHFETWFTAIYVETGYRNTTGQRFCACSTHRQKMDAESVHRLANQRQQSQKDGLHDGTINRIGHQRRW